MKRFVIAATGLALTSTMALAQAATDATTTTTTETTPPAVVVTTPDNAATDVGNAAAAAADKTEDALDAAGNKVDEAVDTGAADTAEDVADKAEDKADAAVTAGSTDTMPATTTETMPATTDTMPATTEPAVVAPATEAAAPVVAPDVNAPAISAEDPGMLGSWAMKRHIWTTNQPSSTAWETVDMTERPADWSDIAKVDDIVMDHQGNLLGYVADIGGFLGIGAKRVLLGKDVLHFVRVGDDAFFATNFTKEELQALPDFDNATVMH